MAMEDAAILEVLSKTPLGVLIDALRSGEFHASPDDPVASDETVIGEMNDEEKVLWSACRRLAERADLIAETHNGLVDEACERNGEVSLFQIRLSKAEHEATVTTLTALRGIMWRSIKGRIGLPATEAPAVGIGIRNGFQIVSFQSQQEQGSFVPFGVFMLSCAR